MMWYCVKIYCFYLSFLRLFSVTISVLQFHLGCGAGDGYLLLSGRLYESVSECVYCLFLTIDIELVTFIERWRAFRTRKTLWEDAKNSSSDGIYRTRIRSLTDRETWKSRAWNSTTVVFSWPLVRVVILTKLNDCCPKVPTLTPRTSTV